MADINKIQIGSDELDITKKQDVLVAGSNIQIAADGKTISATDTTYTNFVGADGSVAGSAGLVPAPVATDNEKYLKGDGTWATIVPKLVEMSYGESKAWAKFIAAYNAGSIVYCRASSNANPATGSQTRKAFMAYVNNATTPTNVEFQYVRSQSSKTDSQQCDQVFIYKLTNASGGTWTVETRNMAPKINVSGPITKTFTTGANATITIGANAMTGATSSAAGTAGIVPAPASGDNTKFLRGDGTWQTVGGGGGAKHFYVGSETVGSPVTFYNDASHTEQTTFQEFQAAILSGPVQLYKEYDADTYWVSEVDVVDIFIDGSITFYAAGSVARKLYTWYESDSTPEFNDSVDYYDQIQADWNVTNSSSKDFIKNKPTAFSGATSSAAGSSGFVPAPASGDDGKFLKGDGTWSTIPSGATIAYLTYSSNAYWTWSDYAATTALSIDDLYQATTSGPVILCVKSMSGTGKDIYVEIVSSNKRFKSGSQQYYNYSFYFYSIKTNAGEPAFATGTSTLLYEYSSNCDGTENKYKSSAVEFQAKLTAGSNISISGSTISGNYQNFTGATSSSAGTSGLVPAPSASSSLRFLASNGTWTSIGTPEDIDIYYVAGTAVDLFITPYDTAFSTTTSGGNFYLGPTISRQYKISYNEVAEYVHMQEQGRANIHLHVMSCGLDNTSYYYDATYYTYEDSTIVSSGTKTFRIEATVASCGASSSTDPYEKLTDYRARVILETTEASSTPSNTVVCKLRTALTPFTVFSDASEFQTTSPSMSGKFFLYFNLPDLVSQNIQGSGYYPYAVDWVRAASTNTENGVRFKWAIVDTSSTTPYITKVYDCDVDSSGKIIIYDDVNNTIVTFSSYVQYVYPYLIRQLGGYSDFSGATSSTAGVHGLVPAPAAGDNEKFLKGNGTWAAIGGTASRTFYVSTDPSSMTSGASISLGISAQADVEDLMDVLRTGGNVFVRDNNQYSPTGMYSNSFSYRITGYKNEVSGLPKVTLYIDAGPITKIVGEYSWSTSGFAFTVSS